jgi:hypothetical protein
MNIEDVRDLFSWIACICIELTSYNNFIQRIFSMLLDELNLRVN